MTSNQDRHVSFQQPGTPPTVVVTGASKGIGAAIVRQLVADGFRVVAGVRRTEDAEALRGQVGERVVPALLDITDPDAVAAAAELVGSETGDRRDASKDKVHTLQICLSSLLVKIGWRPEGHAAGVPGTLGGNAYIQPG